MALSEPVAILDRGHHLAYNSPNNWRSLAGDQAMQHIKTLLEEAGSSLNDSADACGSAPG